MPVSKTSIQVEWHCLWSDLARDDLWQVFLPNTRSHDWITIEIASRFWYVRQSKHANGGIQIFICASTLLTSLIVRLTMMRMWTKIYIYELLLRNNIIRFWPSVCCVIKRLLIHVIPYLFTLVNEFSQLTSKHHID